MIWRPSTSWAPVPLPWLHYCSGPKWAPRLETDPAAALQNSHSPVRKVLSCGGRCPLGALKPVKTPQLTLIMSKGLEKHYTRVLQPALQPVLSDSGQTDHSGGNTATAALA